MNLGYPEPWSRSSPQSTHTPVLRLFSNSDESYLATVSEVGCPLNTDDGWTTARLC